MKTNVPQTDEEIFMVVKSLDEQIKLLMTSREAWITLWAIKHDRDYYSFPGTPTPAVSVAPKEDR